MLASRSLPSPTAGPVARARTPRRTARRSTACSEIFERVVAELEAGDLPLETALKRFEDGVRLARQGGQLLDAVEQRVEMLLEGREGTAPFPGVNDEDDEEEEDDDDV